MNVIVGLAVCCKSEIVILASVLMENHPFARHRVIARLDLDRVDRDMVHKRSYKYLVDYASATFQNGFIPNLFEMPLPILAAQKIMDVLRYEARACKVLFIEAPEGWIFELSF